MKRLGSDTPILFSCGFIVLAFVCLIPLGHWQTDEYQTAAAMRDGDLGALVHRIATWSPRPVSESIIFVYLRAVREFKTQLIAPILGIFWLLLVAGTITPVIVLGRHRKTSLLKLLVIPCCLLSVYLLNHPVAELFYWPMATIAYLPVLTAVSLIFVITELAEADAGYSHQITMWALLVAALSAEVGAMFTTIYAGTALILSFIKRDDHPESRPPYRLLIPLVVSSMVLCQLIQGRVAANLELFGEVRYLHHLLPSALASIPHALWAITSSSDLDTGARSLITGFAEKLAFFLGVLFFSLNEIKTKKRTNQRMALIVAAFSLTPLTLFLAYYQFGTMACCERHDTFRQCLVFVGLASTACLAASFASNSTVFQRLNRAKHDGRLFLLAALIIGIVGSAKNLASDYAQYQVVRTIHKINWAAGMSSGTTMRRLQMSRGRVVGGYPLSKAMSYSIHATPPNEAVVLMDYFNKESVTFEDAPLSSR